MKKKEKITMGLFTQPTVIMGKSNRKLYSQICKASESILCMKFPWQDDNSKMYQTNKNQNKISISR